MIENEKTDIKCNLNINNLQNNQRKENFKSLNQKIKNNKNFFSRKFFKDLGIVENLNKTFKRNMFTKGGSLVLKKSGELIIPTQIKNENILSNSTSSIRTNLNALIIPNIKTINVNHINKLAQYNKINTNKLYFRETLDCKYYQFKLDDRCNFLRDYCMNRFNEGSINASFMCDYFTFLTSIQRGLKVHTVVTEIIGQTDESVTFSYYVITTNKKTVNYGGGNKFKPLLLYTDFKIGKSFYTIPLLCIDRIPKKEFDDLYQIKEKKDFRDNYELQKKLVDNIIRLENDTSILFKQLNIRDVLEKEIRDIDFTKLIEDKNTKYVTTPWIESISNI